MHAHKVKVTVPEDHQLEIRLPSDFPAGPAEVIVLAGSSADPDGGARTQMLRALQNLQDLQRTPEEERILDEFEEFRQRY